MRPSTGSVGDAYDNAMCESFFASLECELIDRGTRRWYKGPSRRLHKFLILLMLAKISENPSLSATPHFYHQALGRAEVCA